MFVFQGTNQTGTRKLNRNSKSVYGFEVFLHSPTRQLNFKKLITVFMVF